MQGLLQVARFASLDFFGCQDEILHLRLPFGVVDILAEDDGFLHGVGLGEQLADLGRHPDGALFQDQAAVEVLLVVDAVFDQLAVLKAV